MGEAHSICGNGEFGPSSKKFHEYSSILRPCACKPSHADAGVANRYFIRGDFLEGLMRKLFSLHDLNCNGLLEEPELVWLNEKIAVLHYGQNFDTTSIKAKYRGLFRSKLDPHGYAVPYAIFREYTLSCLDAMEPHEQAQEMIIEQFIAEAEVVRKIYEYPERLCVAESADLVTTPEEEEEVVKLLSEYPSTLTGTAVSMLDEHVAKRHAEIDLQAQCLDDINPDEEMFHQKPRAFLTHKHLPTGKGARRHWRLAVGGD